MKTGTTRYVIDVDWEDVGGPYGSGAMDCGTVVAVTELIRDAIKEEKLTVGESGLTWLNGLKPKATNVKLISYVTNVSHIPTHLIDGGKALHPKLREQKPKVPKKKPVEPTQPTHKSQVFYDPDFVGDFDQVAAKAKAEGYQYAVSHAMGGPKENGSVAVVKTHKLIWLPNEEKWLTYEELED